ncbi:MAG: CotH kinase family protein [Phycisphaerae bacterium]|nr:CotH kinase family protein [Phycisphaerae bacterium]
MLAALLAFVLAALRTGFTFAVVPPEGRVPPPNPAPAQAPAPDPGAGLFAGEIPRLAFTVAPEDVARLAEDPRRYVRAAMADGTTTLTVAIRLKGAAGSFRPFDDRPALTIDVNRFSAESRFRGLRKFHLNNSVQDESYLNELLGFEAFRSVGIPATRVTHAQVVLNGRDCGLYVLKESFDAAFLKRHFPAAEGNLYDGGLLQDLDAELERDMGRGPTDRSDLRAIVEACRDEDFARGVRTLEELVGMEQLVTLMAVERLLGHWDGYTDSANNYRLYFDPSTAKAVLLPHGLDQILGDPGLPLFDDAGPLLSSTVLRSDRWFERYRQRVAELAPTVFDLANVEATIDAACARLAAPLAELGPDAVARHAEIANDLKRRLRLRAAFLSTHVREPRPEPLRFTAGAALSIPTWAAYRESDRMRLEAGDGPDGHTEYRIVAFGAEPAESTWRTKIPLQRGHYLLHVAMRTDGVASSDEEPETGALLVTSAGNAERERTGTSDWAIVTAPLTVREDWRMVECAIRLRAVRGTVVVRNARIERVADPGE